MYRSTAPKAPPADRALPKVPARVSKPEPKSDVDELVDDFLVLSKTQRCNAFSKCTNELQKC